jgi:phosphoribosylformylglycinamidine synthase
VRLLRRYVVVGGGEVFAPATRTVDPSGAAPDAISPAVPLVFADPAEERILSRPEEVFGVSNETATVLSLGYRYHTGQFDQRADAAEQALRILGLENVSVEVAEMAVFRLRPASDDVAAARRTEFVARLVNPVDSEIVPDLPGAKFSPTAAGPHGAGSDELTFPAEGILADTQLNEADRAFVRDYFAREGREPTETELAVIDTYWSDHCRHTTFRTELEGLELTESADSRLVDEASVGGSEDETDHAVALRRAIAEVRDWYLSERARRDESHRPITLMDLATAMMRWRRADGDLGDVVFSAEINACTLRITDAIPGLDGVVDPQDPWLVLFKNETHNHPTEIEPFGGAATCLGGAIRDPLSGRAYVYQAMRLTGAADPRRLGPRRADASGEALSWGDAGATASTGETTGAGATASARGVPRLPAVGTPTLPGKLPQRLITTGAAHGYSSYGNQIGIATGLVDEVYHPGYRAKRLEMGAVVGAVPEAFVRREEPAPGDLVVLIGGRTGRDGIGGATGSSRSHSRTSIERAGAEVQKGNPPVERALQRLFRRREFTALVKRSNDFGAGGVAVAVGEIAEGLEIDLAAVPLKYHGLTPREIAISESQERMAVVVAAEDHGTAITLAESENLEATVIARVTAERRLVMRSGETTVADISREFLDTAGVRGRAEVHLAVGTPVLPGFAGALRDRRSPGVEPTGASEWIGTSLLSAVETRLTDLRNASRLSLGEWFDSSIGAGTLLAHAGGRLQRSPVTAMAARLPHVFAGAERGETSAPPGVATVMAYGFDPDLSSSSPWCGAYTAVVESLSRLAAAGVAPGAVWLSLQEFFPRPGDDPKRWGSPAAALLGALAAQRDLGVTAIGGKDSMSGSFETIDVPPTLISVALGVMRADRVVPSHMVEAGRPVYLLPVGLTGAGVPDGRAFQEHHRRLSAATAAGEVLAAAPVRGAGWLPALVQMCFGDNLGFDLAYREGALDPAYGSIVVQLRKAPPSEWGAIHLGVTTADGVIVDGDELRRTADLFRRWSEPLEEVFPSTVVTDRTASDSTSVAGHGATDEESESFEETREAVALLVDRRGARRVSRPAGWARPRVLVPVFPGSNCEDDTAAAFADAGALPQQIVLRTLSRERLDESLAAFARALAEAQILALPGGFSAGDEPAGSGKYIAAVLQAPVIREVIEERFVEGDRLILGICNGFQALVRTGLVPFGRFVERRPGWPALAPNTIGRHVSRSVLTRIDSDLGPWMAAGSPGELASVPVSHGEGRLLCAPSILSDLAAAGQVAARYVDWQGRTRLDRPWNPNGSDDAVEALLSPDGRFLGKMGHTERERPGLNRHLPSVGSFDIFAAGVRWFA